MLMTIRVYVITMALSISSGCLVRNTFSPMPLVWWLTCICAVKLPLLCSHAQIDEHVMALLSQQLTILISFLTANVESFFTAVYE